MTQLILFMGTPSDCEKPKPKLTDAECHKRFVEMAREVQASEDPKDFEKAFDKVVPVKSPPAKKK
jgi:hypothetical protein